MGWEFCYVSICMCVSFQFIQWLTQLKIVIGISVSGEGNFAKHKIFWYFTRNEYGVTLTKLDELDKLVELDKLDKLDELDPTHVSVSILAGTQL